MRTARLSRQPALGLAGITLVVPVMLVLGVGFNGAEDSLLVLGPISTFALSVIAMIAFWWEDWPGTVLRAPLTGLVDTVLVVVGGVVLTVAGQAVVSHVDLRGVFDPTAGASHAPTFPATMPLAAAIFSTVLELTLVCEGWPLHRLDRLAGGVAITALGWAIGIALYETLVAHAGGPQRPAQFGAALVCVAVMQVTFFVVLGGWPFRGIGSRALRLVSANLVVIGAGVGAFLALDHAADVDPGTISAIAGTAVAAGLVIGMLFEGWLNSLLSTSSARLVNATSVAIGTAVLYVALRAYAHAVGFTDATPEAWVAYAGLNAIGAGVILHVAIGRRWPFAAAVESRALA